MRNSVLWNQLEALERSARALREGDLNGVEAIASQLHVLHRLVAAQPDTRDYGKKVLEIEKVLKCRKMGAKTGPPEGRQPTIATFRYMQKLLLSRRAASVLEQYQDKKRMLEQRSKADTSVAGRLQIAGNAGSEARQFLIDVAKEVGANTYADRLGGGLEQAIVQQFLSSGLHARIVEAQQDEVRTLYEELIRFSKELEWDAKQSEKRVAETDRSNNRVLLSERTVSVLESHRNGKEILIGRAETAAGEAELLLQVAGDARGAARQLLIDVANEVGANAYADKLGRDIGVQQFLRQGLRTRILEPQQAAVRKLYEELIGHAREWKWLASEAQKKQGRGRNRI